MNYNDIKLPERPDPDGYITIKIIGRDVEVNAYRDSTMEAYAREAVRLNSCESRASTHAEGCWSWGPGHYGCAVGTIERLRQDAERYRWLREALRELITWIPSADTYRRLGFDPEAPMRALGEARAALKQEADRG